MDQVAGIEGPWDVWGPSCGVYHVQATDSNGDQFTLCDGITDEAVANLIAAAPALLAACRDALEYIDRLGYVGDGYCYCYEHHSTLQALRTAIAQTTSAAQF